MGLRQELHNRRRPDETVLPNADCSFQACLLRREGEIEKRVEFLCLSDLHVPDPNRSKRETFLPIQCEPPLQAKSRRSNKRARFLGEERNCTVDVTLRLMN